MSATRETASGNTSALRLCPDCEAEPGQPHEGGCDVARCLPTDAQRLSCDFFGRDPDETGHDCGQDIWTGRRGQHAPGTDLAAIAAQLPGAEYIDLTAGGGRDADAEMVSVKLGEHATLQLREMPTGALAIIHCGWAPRTASLRSAQVVARVAPEFAVSVTRAVLDQLRGGERT